MGKGKGSFDHWATRIGVSKIIFELKGDLHEQIVRDAFRLAASKLPGRHLFLLLGYYVDKLTYKGLYEFVRKGDPPMMGITKVREGMTLEEMRRPRIKPPIDTSASRLPATTPP